MFVAIDAGTSGVKTALFDVAGRSVNEAKREMAVSRPQHLWAEQDMSDIWAAVAETVDAVVADRTDIEFIAVTGQGDGCWLVDEAGVPTGPAILWNDGRASEIITEWRGNGTIAEGYRRNGSISFPGLSNAALRWLIDHDEGRISRSAQLLSCSAWVYFNLTGLRRIEVSDASAPFLDAETGDYSDELLGLYGLQACKRLLPPIVTGATAIGALTAGSAGRLALPTGIPVILAPYDVASAALGSGAVEPGQAVVVLGTTIFTGVVTDLPRVNGEPVGSTIALGIPGRYLRFFPALSGLEVVTWVGAMLGLENAAAVVELAETAPPGANGLSMLPYLSPAGERAPFLDPAASGSFWNLSLEHNRADIARATVEALTMVIRDCVEASAIEITELRLSGGGANTPFWCQLIADVTGLETMRTADAEVTAKGALIAGMLATGRAADAAEAVRDCVEPGRRWVPDAGMAQFYSVRYAEFCRLRELASRTWHDRTEAVE